MEILLHKVCGRPASRTMTLRAAGPEDAAAFYALQNEVRAAMPHPEQFVPDTLENIARYLKESYETFAKGPAELAGRDYTEKDMNEFIVGAAAKLDTPRKPREEAASTDCKYFCGITDEMTAAERKSLCSVDAAALKAEAADLSARMEKGVRVVFGSKEAVEAAKELFDRVETL